MTEQEIENIETSIDINTDINTDINIDTNISVDTSISEDIDVTNTPAEIDKQYNDIIKKQELEATINELKQKISTTIDETIEKLKTSVNALLIAINGIDVTTVDPNVLIGSIKSLLSPITTLTDLLSKIGIPSIPGISDISTLLGSLSAGKSELANIDLSAAAESVKNSAESTVNTASSEATNTINTMFAATSDAASVSTEEIKMPEIPDTSKLPALPDDLKSIVQNLQSSSSTLCSELPMVLINIILITLKQILDVSVCVAPFVYMPLKTRIGIPPAILIDAILALAPSMTTITQQLPSKLTAAVETVLKQQVSVVGSLQVPEPPENVPVIMPVEDIIAAETT